MASKGKHAEKSTTVAMIEDVVIFHYGEEECLYIDDQNVKRVIDIGAMYHATSTHPLRDSLRRAK